MGFSYTKSNSRRIDLIEKKLISGLTDKEIKELDKLTKKCSEWRHKRYPLITQELIDDVERLREISLMKK